jgi:hypothetical protein
LTWVHCGSQQRRKIAEARLLHIPQQQFPLELPVLVEIEVVEEGVEVHVICCQILSTFEWDRVVLEEAIGE